MEYSGHDKHFMYYLHEIYNDAGGILFIDYCF